jgi:hypothetical protein
MIGFRDTTFCVSPDCQNKCGRKLTKEIIKQAEEWWGNEDAPIAVSCFCGGELEDTLKNDDDYGQD